MNELRNEMQRLDNEARDTELQAQSSLTKNEKQTLLHAADDSLKKLGVIDYKLIRDIIRDIENKYPRPTNTAEQESTLQQETSSTAHIITPESSPDVTSLKSNAHSLPSSKSISTTTTPPDRPDSRPCDKPPSASPAVQRMNDQQLHRYFGFRNLKSWMDLETTGQDTIKIVKGNE
jgi:hypothetical protein